MRLDARLGEFAGVGRGGERRLAHQRALVVQPVARGGAPRLGAAGEHAAAPGGEQIVFRVPGSGPGQADERFLREALAQPGCAWRNALGVGTQFRRRAEEDAAQHQAGDAMRVRAGVFEREQTAPGAAEHDPALDRQRCADALDVGDEVGGGIGAQAAERRAATAAALVEEHGAKSCGVEQAALAWAAAAARTTVQEDHGDAVGAAAFLHVQHVAAPHREAVRAERRRLGPQRRRGARGRRGGVHQAARSQPLSQARSTKARTPSAISAPCAG